MIRCAPEGWVLEVFLRAPSCPQWFEAFQNPSQFNNVAMLMSFSHSARLPPPIEERNPQQDHRQP